MDLQKNNITEMIKIKENWRYEIIVIVIYIFIK